MRHAEIRRQSELSVPGNRFPRPLRSRRPLRLQGGRVSVPLRLSTGRDRRAAAPPRPRPGLVQYAARRLGGGRARACRDGVEQAIAYAKATGCRILHAMAGLWPQGRERAEGMSVYVENLRHAADRLAGEGLTLVIEPINTRDIPGYFLNTTGEAAAVIERVGRPNLKMQHDQYQEQIMDCEHAHRKRALAARYAFAHIVGHPQRHEP